VAEDLLIVGLGNPGRAYEKTRHNLGFLCTEKFAEKHGFPFRKSDQFSGKIAVGQFSDKKVYLLLPLTYMNCSGEVVQSVAKYFRVAPHHILVVCDDINLPFGSLRMRSEGSAGGHNGLKSIEAHLGTRGYPRLRVGVGDRVQGELADYVLSPFTKEEMEELPKIIENSIADIEQWVKGQLPPKIQ
jgi:peptidyl-tRNA hydrolase, PTH1 family